MALATQSTRPSAIVPGIRDYLVKSLKLDQGRVRIGVRESESLLPQKAQKQITLQLSNPVPENPNAGAGRLGFPMTRKLFVHVITRNMLDQSGRDELALLEHWDFQDAVVNALLDAIALKKFLVLVPRFIGGSDEVKKDAKAAPGVYESSLAFELNYVAAVEVPDPS